MFFVHVEGSRSSLWPLCRGMDASEVSCVQSVGQQSGISIFSRTWLRDNLKIYCVWQWGMWSHLVLACFSHGLVFEFSSVYRWWGCAWVWISKRHLKMQWAMRMKFHSIKMSFRVCSRSQSCAGEETLITKDCALKHCWRSQFRQRGVGGRKQIQWKRRTLTNILGRAMAWMQNTLQNCSARKGSGS